MRIPLGRFQRLFLLAGLALSMGLPAKGAEDIKISMTGVQVSFCAAETSRCAAISSDQADFARLSDIVWFSNSSGRITQAGQGLFTWDRQDSYIDYGSQHIVVLTKDSQGKIREKAIPLATLTFTGSM